MSALALLCPHCAHYHRDACGYLSLTATTPCPCEGSAVTVHRFTVEIHDPGVPEANRPPMSREEAKEILHDTLYERHKHSYFDVTLDGEPAS